MGTTRYSKEIEDVIDKITSDEKILERIDKLTKGSKVVCIKNCVQKPQNYYDNFRDYLTNRKKEEWYYEEGSTYEVNSIRNDIVYINSTPLSNGKSNTNPFFLLDLKDYATHVYNARSYVFDYFMLESEWLGLQRDKKIEEIIN